MADFDVSKFTSNTSKSSSNVKSFYTETTVKLTEGDLRVCLTDLVVILPLTAFVGLNLAFMGYAWGNVPISLICPTWGIVAGMVALWRYSHMLAYQGQSRIARGRLQWEHVSSENVGNGKAHVRFVRESNGFEAVTGNEIKLNSISYDKLLDLANIVTETKQYNQRLLVDKGICSPKTYDTLSQELIQNGIIKYRSDNPKQGYMLTEHGVNLLADLRR